MPDHLHTGFEHLFPVFVGVWVLWNFARIVAAWLAKQGGTMGSLGSALGSTL